MQTLLEFDVSDKKLMQMLLVFDVSGKELMQTLLLFDVSGKELMQTLLEKFLHLQSLLLEQNAETRLISLHDSRCVCTSC